MTPPPRRRGAKRTTGAPSRGSRRDPRGKPRAGEGQARARRTDGPRGGSGLGGQQVEGRQAVRELLLAGRRRVYELWVTADVAERGGVGDLIALAHDQRVPVQQVARKRLEAEARSEAPQGVLAKAAPLAEADVDDLATGRRGAAPFLVLVDGVTDPGNLGALLRSAEGAGVTGVVLPRHRAAHVTPTVAKAAAGAVEHLPIALVPGLPSAIERLRRKGIWVVGLDDAASASLFDLSELAQGPVALVLGAEGPGLSRLVRQRCDLLVAIPMRGALSSLNVAASAALACYEVARHRA